MGAGRRPDNRFPRRLQRILPSGATGRRCSARTSAPRRKRRSQRPKPQESSLCRATSRAIAKAEREIAKLEAKIAALDAEAEANGSDYQKLMELSAEREGLENELLELYEQWEELNG